MASGEFGFYNYVDDTNGWVDVLGLARTYSAREQALPQHLKDRPKWRKKTKKHLDSTAINGKFYDAKTGKEIKGKKVIGHQNETWREYQDNPANHTKTRKQVIDDYNDINNLGYEDATQSSIDGGTFKGIEN